MTLVKKIPVQSIKSHGRNFHLSIYKTTFFFSECNLKTKMALDILNGVFKNCKVS